MEQLLTLNDIATRAKISTVTVWRYRKCYSDFPRPVIIGTLQRFSATEVDEWFKSHRADSAGVDHAKG